MRFATDSYFHIGQLHLNTGKPCQDYALSGSCEDVAFAIVSDGCSSAGRTDVGARMMALATAREIRRFSSACRKNFLEDAPAVMSGVRSGIIEECRIKLELNHEDMLATCLYQYVTPYFGYVHIQGDGVFAWKDRSGRITMYRYEWMPDNEGSVRPLYPAYSVDGLNAFIQSHGGDLIVERFTRECWEYTSEGEFIEHPVQFFTLFEGICGATSYFSLQELEEVDCLAVFSDGVTQIEGMDWKDAVLELLSFKSTKGAFAKRRMMRVIRDAERSDKGPMDDISFAVVRIILEEDGAVE